MVAEIASERRRNAAIARSRRRPCPRRAAGGAQPSVSTIIERTGPGDGHHEDLWDGSAVPFGVGDRRHVAGAQIWPGGPPDVPACEDQCLPRPPFLAPRRLEQGGHAAEQALFEHTVIIGARLTPRLPTARRSAAIPRWPFGVSESFAGTNAAAIAVSRMSC